MILSPSSKIQLIFNKLTFAKSTHGENKSCISKSLIFLRKKNTKKQGRERERARARARARRHNFRRQKFKQKCCMEKETSQ